MSNVKARKMRLKTFDTLRQNSPVKPQLNGSSL